MTIAVTGATGKLGGRVARRLADTAVAQRLIVRDLARAPHLPHATAAAASYEDTDAARAALQNVRTLLMVSAPEGPDRVAQHRSLIDAAAAAGVEHVVYISFFGASPSATFTLARDHWHTEHHLRASGMDFTFLRDNIYADFFPDFIGDDGVLRAPAGDGRVAGVAQDDVAEVASAILKQPAQHSGASYDLTGPQSLSLDEVVQTLRKVTGSDVQYEPQTVAQAYASRRVFTDSQWQLDAWVSTYQAIATGELDGVSNAVPTITGHVATSFEELLRR